MKDEPTGGLLGRAQALDALRGLAIVWMVAFHLCFDLNHFGLLQPPQQFLVDPFWTVQRACIVGLFMFCAGAGQALAADRDVPWPRFWRRWLQIAACAALVSLATWLVFPRSWIFFGVLHGLAVMVLLARLMATLPTPLLLFFAVDALTLPLWAAHPAFDAPWLQWLGLGTRKPITEDYAPLLPWLGMVLLGLACGRQLLAWSVLARWSPPRWLTLLGRWPLSIYMLHQPLLWGAILLFTATMRP